VKIYVYGYLNQGAIEPALERECQRNIELVWLTGRLMPDFKTIADFAGQRRGHPARSVVSSWCLCRRLVNCSARRALAIDGSKFKAVNTRDRNFTQAKMQRRLAQITKHCPLPSRSLIAPDRQGEAVPEAKITRLNEKIATLRQEIQPPNTLNTR